MMPYRKRYTVWMQVKENSGLIFQALTVAALLAVTSIIYQPAPAPAPAPAIEEMSINDAVAACQTRGYFDVGTVHVSCQVRE